MQTVADLQLFHVLKYTITGNKYKFAQIVQETASIQNQFIDQYQLSYAMLKMSATLRDL